MSTIISVSVLLAILSFIFGGAFAAKMLSLNLIELFRAALIANIFLFFIFACAGSRSGLLTTTLFAAFGFSYLAQKLG
jgi:hypothetical protein